MTNNVVLGSKRIQLFGLQGAGNTVLTSAAVDMQGFESAVFEVAVGTLTAGQTLGTIQVQSGLLANQSDAANLVGASITVADADTGKLEVIEVFRPDPTGTRFLTLVLTRSTQSMQILSVTVTLYGDKKVPESDDAASVAQTLLAVEPRYTNAQLTQTTTTPVGTTTKVSTTSRSSS